MGEARRLGSAACLSRPSKPYRRHDFMVTIGYIMSYYIYIYMYSIPFYSNIYNYYRIPHPRSLEQRIWAYWGSNVSKAALTRPPHFEVLLDWVSRQDLPSPDGAQANSLRQGLRTLTCPIVALSTPSGSLMKGRFPKGSKYISTTYFGP